METDEYSESGRGVYPDGLYRMLLQFHERYKHLNVPFIITENGVSDTSDLIRQPYLLEHLLAVHAAMIMVFTLGLIPFGISSLMEIKNLCAVSLLDRVSLCSATCFGLFLIIGNGLMDMDPNLD